MITAEIILALSLQYGVPAHLVESIIRVESNYCAATYNLNRNKTHDYGCMQVNSSNLTAQEIQIIKKYPEYGLHKGMTILVNLKKRFPNSYVCRYNVGVGKLEGVRLKNCNIYLNKINQPTNKYFKRR